MRRLVAIVGALALGVLSCRKDAPTEPNHDAVKLLVIVQPAASVAVGASISISVFAADADGNTVVTATPAVTVKLANGSPAGATLGGTLTRIPAGGIATFDDLTLDKAGAGYALTVSDPSGTLAPVTSQTFTVTSVVVPVATKLAIVASPTAAQSLTANLVQVIVRDAGGNTVTNSTASITIAITGGTGTAGATLGGTLTQSAVNGVATFSNLTIDKAGTGYTLTAASSGLTGAVSNAFSVTFGVAAKLSVAVQPTSAIVNASISPSIEIAVQDASGNAVTSATNTVTIAITSGTGTAGAALGGTLANAAVAGTATFSNLTVDKSGTGYTLTATATALSAAVSTAFDIVVAGATKLTLTTNAAGAPSAAQFTTQPVVTLQDAGGVTVTSDNSTVVTMTVSGSGIVVGTATATASAGVATFSTVGISGKADTTYTLTFAKSGLTSATQTIIVTPGAATQLAFTVQPTSGSAVGAVLAPSPRVTVQDSRGNTVTTATTSITVALVANSPGAVLGGTKIVSAISGVATFSTLTIDKSATGYTLGASATSLTGATSSAFDIAAFGAASKLAFTVQPANAEAGAVISPAVQVAVQDANGNTVTTSTASVTLAYGANPGSGTLGGTVTTSASSGIATFSTLTNSVVANNYTLFASATALTSATSSAFNITVVTPTWIQLSPTGAAPVGRYLHSAVYDEAHDRMIVFGGYDRGAIGLDLNDTWVLQNASGSGGTPSWTQLTTSGGPPTARSGHSAVYDATNNRMIIFDGTKSLTTGMFNDVWVLSNANGLGGTPTWTQLSPAAGPAVRANHSAVYDQANNRMTIFGGNPAVGSCSQGLNDTWVLSNANGLGGTPAWAQLSPTGGPPGIREFVNALYDQASNRMTVLWGQPSCGSASPGTDMWKLTGANGTGSAAWSQITATPAPSARGNFSLVYDVATRSATIFGGGTSTTYMNDVWVLSDANGQAGTSAWTQLAPTGSAPAVRGAHTAVYNATLNRMIMFGGSGGTGNDVWVLTHANGLP